MPRVSVSVTEGATWQLLADIVRAVRRVKPHLSEVEAAELAKTMCMHRGIVEVADDLRNGVLPPPLLV